MKVLHFVFFLILCFVFGALVVGPLARRWRKRDRKKLCPTRLPSKLPHRWRPAITTMLGSDRQRYTRKCYYCLELQVLTKAEFYAQFGENYYAAGEQATRR